jgi:hypothetical protein
MTITKVTDAGLDRSRIVTPIIINGDMSVAQRATSVTGVTSGTYKTIDRFRILISGAGTWTLSQSTTVPTGQGFNNSFKYDCTTADASLGSSDILGLSQKIEGFNQAAVKKGTANAEKTTLAFWVRSNKTGTYIAELYDDQNTRQVSKSYTIDSANTWEKKVIVFPADTVGANDFDNTQAMQVNWWLAMGSDYTSGTLSETWTSATSANRAVGQVNLADSTDNEWYCTGVQLEVGEFDANTIPSFPFESFENNLRKCMRYYENFTASGSHKTSTVFGEAAARCYFEYKVKKRSTPTVTISQSAGNGAGNVSFLTKGGAYVGTIGTHEILNSAIDGFNLNIASGYSSTGWSEGFAVMFYVNGNNYEVWTADAEL